LSRFTSLVKAAARWSGFEITRTPAWRPDLTAEDAAIVASVRPFTLTSRERVLALIDATRYLVRSGIPGAFVECGVWKGGSAMAMAMTLLAAGDPARDLRLFDTFDGMPPPGDADRSFDGVPASLQLQRDPPGTGLWARAGAEEVRRNLASTRYPTDRVQFIQGRVEDTIPANAPESIALLRLDTDWYESTRHELTHLYPRLVRGGVLIIDDYGHWLGARQATDEYLSALDRPVFLHRIDYTGRIAVKP
jgi:predicted O-methyltransferase YrrM